MNIEEGFAYTSIFSLKSLPFTSTYACKNILQFYGYGSVWAENCGESLDNGFFVEFGDIVWVLVEL